MTVNNKTIGWLLWLLVSLSFVYPVMIFNQHPAGSDARMALGLWIFCGVSSLAGNIACLIISMMGDSIKFNYQIPLYRNTEIEDIKMDLINQISLADSKEEVELLENKIEAINKSL